MIIWHKARSLQTLCIAKWWNCPYLDHNICCLSRCHYSSHHPGLSSILMVSTNYFSRRVLAKHQSGFCLVKLAHLLYAKARKGTGDKRTQSYESRFTWQMEVPTTLSPSDGLAKDYPQRLLVPTSPNLNCAISPFWKCVIQFADRFLCSAKIYGRNGKGSRFIGNDKHIWVKIFMHGRSELNN